jgi:hypothetical protein
MGWSKGRASKEGALLGSYTLPDIDVRGSELTDHILPFPAVIVFNRQVAGCDLAMERGVILLNNTGVSSSLGAAGEGSRSLRTPSRSGAKHRRH